MQELFYLDIDDISSIKQPEHYMVVDTYDEGSLAYCLCRRIDDNADILILLAKTMRNRKEFDLEVKNLSKYFNAKIIKETN
jgi:hypothetical protein